MSKEVWLEAMISSNSGAASDFAASVVSAFASAAAAVVSPAAAAVVSAGLDDPHPAKDDTIITPASTNANLFFILLLPSLFYFHGHFHVRKSRTFKEVFIPPAD